MVYVWRFKCYVSPSGRNKIQDWYDDLLIPEQADADEFLSNMQKKREWKMPDWKRLSGGIGELRWRSEGKQHRLIGFLQDNTFVALIGCTHKQKRYKPDNAMNTAARRRSLLNTGEGSTCEYDL